MGAARMPWERGVAIEDLNQTKDERMTSIGIVGTGISGLQLALTLQRAGVDTTLYAEKAPDEMRAGRLPNSVVRFAKTIERERALDVAHWVDSAGARVESMHVSILDTPVGFVGHLEQQASGVDFRVYLPRLLEDYAERGGRVALGARSPEDVVAGIDDHDLTVVATGRDSVAAFFPRDEGRSPYGAPQRRLCVMHVHGIAPLDIPGASFSIAPGVGEIFTFPFLSALGSVTCLAFEAIPGGPLEPITRMGYDEDPAAFEEQVLELLKRFAPDVSARIDRAEFAVTGPLDLLQGALTPMVRRPYCEVAPGRFVVAVGDAYVTNDPICGQGANLGSTSAAILADAICRDVAFDGWFCRGLARDMWAAAEPVTRWNNSFLAPPPPHVEAILGAAAQSAAVADAFCDMWADPAAMWRAIATPERAAAFLASVGAPPVAMAA
jgi:2-polyprenyl-6-methoxyphenol hydroxylase-like FAD-dependent oxidoreductase